MSRRLTARPADRRFPAFCPGRTATCGAPPRSCRGRTSRRRARPYPRSRSRGSCPEDRRCRTCRRSARCSTGLPSPRGCSRRRNSRSRPRARALGLNGAEIVFNPSATVAGLSQYLWKLEQPAHAVANGYFVAASNRVGTEAPWNIGRFYGTSYIVDPRGNFLATASEDKDELVVATCDLDMIEEVRRTWQFFRDRRPETYDRLVAL